jgi:polysaccharide deacetylase 2 family uncharacterized protein YibQ
MLVLAALVYMGGRFIVSPRGRYVVATRLLGGGPDRVRPLLESALARAAGDLNLPPPYPAVACEPDSGGTHRCTSVVTLTPGVSTLQGNAHFTRHLLDAGVALVSGTETRTGTVNLRYRAGSKVAFELQLVPAAGSGLDTTVTPAPGLGRVEVRARLALIVEEYGSRRDLSRRFGDLPGTFTAALRPNQDNAQAWAKEARQAGMEVILSLPMEPKNYPTRNPGEGAILVDLSGREIRKRVDRALETIGDVPGVKTYMGSLAVEDRDVMRPILEELKKRDLFLIEATHSQFSTVSELAREIEVPIFAVTSISEVDAGRGDAGTIGIRFDDLVRRCRAKGYAIGIVHPKAGTLTVLEDRLPRLAREGIVVMGLSEVMKAHALQ